MRKDPFQKLLTFAGFLKIGKDNITLSLFCAKVHISPSALHYLRYTFIGSRPDKMCLYFYAESLFNSNVVLFSGCVT